MSAHTEAPVKYFIGAQNDSLFIVVGEPPAKGNDSPRHDADRTPIAHIYDESACDALVRAGNAHVDLVKALQTIEIAASFAAIPDQGERAVMDAALNVVRATLAKASA